MKEEKGEGYIATVVMLLAGLFIFALLLEISDKMICCNRIRSAAQTALEETLQEAAIEAYPRLKEGERTLSYNAAKLKVKLKKHIEEQDWTYLTEEGELREFSLQCSEDGRVAALGFCLQMPLMLMGQELLELNIPINISAVYALKGE